MAKITEYKVTKPIHNPAHPGEVLQEVVVQGLQMKVSDAAKKLGVDRTTLSRLMHGHIAISIEMALRLAKALSTTPQFWLNMQQNYDLAQIHTQNLDLSRVGRLSADGVALA